MTICVSNGGYQIRLTPRHGCFWWSEISIYYKLVIDID